MATHTITYTYAPTTDVYILLVHSKMLPKCIYQIYKLLLSGTYIGIMHWHFALI